MNINYNRYLCPANNKYIPNIPANFVQFTGSKICTFVKCAWILYCLNNPWGSHHQLDDQYKEPMVNTKIIELGN